MMTILLVQEPCGSSISVSADRRSATRRNAVQEFNNGIVLTSQALEDNELVSVTIDALVPTWTGSIQLGVTARDPRGLDTLPDSAAHLKACTWLYTGTCILYNGKQIIENYGTANLDNLAKGDRVGVVRQSNGSVHFVVNGVDQGVAASNTPSRLFAVLDLYGKCVQISINDIVPVENMNILAVPSPNSLALPMITSSSASNREQVASCMFDNFTTPPIAYQNSASDSFTSRIMTVGKRRLNASTNFMGNSRENSRASNLACCSSSGEQDTAEGPLRFHERCGSNIRLAPDLMSAERIHPIDQFNHGVILSNRPLRHNELFEIRIDALVTKWSGSLEVGVTSHSPEQLDFPETMTCMRSGTIMMNGLGILVNGMTTKTAYASTDLDHLRVGDRVGVVWRSGGHVHFVINGVDQGVAATDVPEGVYGVVDLYGRSAQVSIVVQLAQQQQQTDEDQDDDQQAMGWNSKDRLQWFQRPLCFAATDSVAFSTDLRTALFVSSGSVQSATLLSERSLRIGEAFLVRLRALPLGAHVSIGVAMRVPSTTESSVSHESGLWFFPSRGLTLDGQLFDKNYGRDVATQLKKGDRVGVFVARDTSVHFCVNDRDLGVALQLAPLPLWGVGSMLLSGPAPQTCVVSLVQPERPLIEDFRSDLLRLHTTRHGAKALVLNSGLTAVRVDPYKDFNLAIVTSDRPLYDNEIFEVVVEEMEGRWKEVGVTSVPPEQMKFLPTAKDARPDTWMLSGSTMMCAGSSTSVDYAYDLNLVRVGSRVGVQRKDDGSLHYFIDGHDMGEACSGMPSTLWAVIDMYGQCARVSVVYAAQSIDQQVQSSGLSCGLTHACMSFSQQARTGGGSTSHQLNKSCGHNVVLRNDGRSACRTLGFNNGLLFSCGPLDLEELFEVQIEQIHANMLTANVIVGLTTYDPQGGPVNYRSFQELLADTRYITCLVVGRKVYSNTTLVKDNYGSPALARATGGERVGVEHCSDGTMHVYVNGEDQNVATQNLPRAMLAVFDLFGAIESVSLCSSAFVPSRHTPSCYEALPVSVCGTVVNRFLESLIGSNIQLAAGGTSAKRVASFNDAIVMSAQPLAVDQAFSVRVSRLSSAKWESSMCIGILGEIPLILPSSALEFTKLCWLIIGKSVYVNGRKVKDNYGPNLDHLKEQSTVGVLVDSSRQMHLLVNGIDQGIACGNVFASRCFALCDLYGRCEKLEVLQDNEPIGDPLEDTAIEALEKAHLDDNQGRKENLQEPRPVQIDRTRLALAACPNHQVAIYFLRYVLCLPWHLVDSQRCSCDTCLLQGNVKGKMMKKCSTFTLKTSVRSSPSWDVAFSLEIPLGAIRKCVDHGRLLARQEWGVAPVVAAGASAKHLDGKTSAPIVCATPCLRYALSRAPAHRFSPRGFSEPKESRIVLQALICPDSYQKVFLTEGGQSMGSASTVLNVNPSVQQEKWEEWHTKEKSATAVQAIIVCLD
ncbi:neuralized-like protein 4 isoform X3 [Varroa jacobsoni]|uniref:neuralized-like protein 4 isoform X3 n=1 Tax=Varroa jacobsoni TaxID=62625 RepID=UPI000BFA257E|nr:neuralized-like protein 4 isoform X3 [Varroa jacobsoni]